MEREMTMVERCAKAIDAVMHHEDDTDPDCTLRYARAVIEAMREPSAAVEFTVDRLFNFNPGAGDGKEYWQRMIDAALKEEEKAG